MIRSRKRNGSRVRFRLWEATFCSDTIRYYQKNQDKLAFPSLRVRLAFGALLELSSGPLRLPEASEGIIEWSGLIVMVDVMFIDRSGGCLSPMSRVSSAVGGMASGVLCPAWSFPSNRGARCRTFNYCLTPVITVTIRCPDRPPTAPFTTPRSSLRHTRWVQSITS